MRLFLVRHGQTAWNLAGRAQGHTDIPLDELGQSQAIAVGRAFTGQKLDQVYVSDLERARATAEAICAQSGAPMKVRTDLRERSFGQWEGQSFNDVHKWAAKQAAEQGTDLLNVRPPNGESFADVWARLDPIVEEFRAARGTVAVVGHGGSCAVLLAKLLRGSLETSRGFRFGNTAICELERRGDGFFFLVRYNDSAHLAERMPMVGSVDGTGR